MQFKGFFLNIIYLLKQVTTITLSDYFHDCIVAREKNQKTLRANFSNYLFIYVLVNIFYYCAIDYKVP